MSQLRYGMKVGMISSIALVPTMAGVALGRVLVPAQGPVRPLVFSGVCVQNILVVTCREVCIRGFDTLGGKSMYFSLRQ